MVPAALVLILCSGITDQAKRAVTGGLHGKDSVALSDHQTDSAFAEILSDSTALTDSVSEARTDTYLKEPFTVIKFDREKWKAAKKGIDYSDVDPPKKKKQTETFTWFSGSTLFSGDVVKFIFVTIVILLLAFLLFKIFSGRLSNKKVVNDKSIVSVEDIEDISLVPESELERLLKEALNRKDFNEAIRIYYVFIIRELSEKELIRWKKEKTNRDYVSELREMAHYGIFRELTLLFERVWYGDILLQEADYSRVGPRFKSFADTIKLSTPGEK